MLLSASPRRQCDGLGTAWLGGADQCRRGGLSTVCFLLWSECRLGQLQEAVIGPVFVVAAGAELILLAFNPHGAEHLKDLLVGKILWVELHQLIPVAVLYGAVLLASAMFDLRRQRLVF